MSPLIIFLFLFSSSFIFGKVCCLESQGGVNISNWDFVLKTSVHPGFSSELGHKSNISLNIVNYTKISQMEEFHTYLNELENATTTKLTKQEWYAFWMNVYNALAVKMVINHPCKKDLFGSCGALDSIRQVGEQQPSIGALTKVWTRAAGIVEGKVWSLDDIELMLRQPDKNEKPWKEDSRLHMCIVCASISCPNLRNEAYVREKLDGQMNDQMKSFLKNDKKGMSLDKTDKSVKISPIYNWYSGDFKSEVNGSIIDFIAPYTDDEDFLLKNKIKVSYFNYNWDANGSLKQVCGKGDRICFPWWGLVTVILAVFILAIIFVCILKARKRRSVSYETDALIQ